MVGLKRASGSGIAEELEFVARCGRVNESTRPKRSCLFFRGVYVALLGINRGVVKVDAIAVKMSFRLVTVCEESWQVLPDPLWL